jgi:general secretion pathway protein K
MNRVSSVSRSTDKRVCSPAGKPTFTQTLAPTSKSARKALNAASRQRGMAVIAALLVVAVAAVLTAGLFQRQATLARGIENDQSREQARWLLIAGIDWARLILRADGRRHATTRGDQLWATPIADMEVSRAGSPQQAWFSGFVEDEQGKLNLTSLAIAGQVRESSVLALQSLTASLSLPAELAVRMAQRVAESQYRMDGPKVVGMPGRPGIAALDDLRSVDGIDARAIQALHPFVSVLPAGNAAVNVNTASPEVLNAVVPGLGIGTARQLVAARERGQWFRDRADFINRLPTPLPEAGDANLDVGSEWFLVTGTVRIARADARVQALLRRQDQQSPRLIWLREL